jgi:hypothetical protein
MNHPSILDIVRAVKEMASGHPEIRAWWHAPAPRLALHGAHSASPGRGLPEVTVVVEATDAGTWPDCERIRTELARKLPDAEVYVRRHRGDDEPERLYRLLSRPLTDRPPVMIAPIVNQPNSESQ